MVVCGTVDGRNSRVVDKLTMCVARTQLFIFVWTLFEEQMLKVPDATLDKEGLNFSRRKINE